MSSTGKTERCPTCGNSKNDPKEDRVGLNEYKTCDDNFHEYLHTQGQTPEPFAYTPNFEEEAAEATIAELQGALETVKRIANRELKLERQRTINLQELLAGKDDLLVAYRTGNNKLADKALTRIDKARAALANSKEKQP